jgi:hypothetical protein
LAEEKSSGGKWVIALVVFAFLFILGTIAPMEEECETAYREDYVDNYLTEAEYCENFNKDWP